MFWWVKVTEPGVIAEVIYVPREEIKSEVVPWGLEFSGENRGSHTQFILLWVKSSLLVYTIEDLV